jgi:predicted nucleic acid-binding Zn ribbon protein
MKSIKNYLSKKDLFQTRNIDEKTIFYIFKKVVKEEFGNIGADKFKAEYFKDKTIFIKSDSSVWSSELWLNKDKIVRKINQEAGGKVIEKIKI